MVLSLQSLLKTIKFPVVCYFYIARKGVIGLQEGNLDIDLEFLRREMLLIATEFDKFCAENDLRYFICCGSLLGGVRHGGFIPWDDDFDVAMPRSDYQKFLAKWEDSDNIKRISLGMAGYYKVGTPSKLYNPEYVIEEKYEFENGMPKYNPYGIFIDIFPLDNYPDTLIGHFVNAYVGKILQAKSFSQFKMNKRKVTSRIIFTFLRFIPAYVFKFIYKISQNLISKKSAKRFWGYGIETTFSNLVADEDILFPLAQIKFSGLNLKAPNNPDGYLKKNHFQIRILQRSLPIYDNKIFY